MLRCAACCCRGVGILLGRYKYLLLFLSPPLTLLPTFLAHSHSSLLDWSLITSFHLPRSFTPFPLGLVYDHWSQFTLRSSPIASSSCKSLDQRGHFSLFLLEEFTHLRLLLSTSSLSSRCIFSLPPFTISLHPTFLLTDSTPITHSTRWRRNYSGLLSLPPQPRRSPHQSPSRRPGIRSRSPATSTPGTTPADSLARRPRQRPPRDPLPAAAAAA